MHWLPTISAVHGGSRHTSQRFALPCPAPLTDTVRMRLAAPKRSVTHSRCWRRSGYGARCERFFGTANTQFIHTLAGNTQHLRDPRGMSSEVDPRRDVLWTLPELDRCLEEYLFRIYPAQPQPGLQGTPYERFTQGLELTGQRLHRKVPYDQKFFLLSLPPSHRGIATVDAKKGVIR